jgi:hypothetical protein
MRGYANDRTEPDKICNDLGFTTKTAESTNSTLSPQHIKGTMAEPEEESKDSDLFSFTVSEGDTFNRLPAERLEEAKRMLKTEKGLTVLLEILRKAGKPLVGHNSSFDLGFLTNQLMGSMPQTFPEWNRQLRSHLGPLGIYDTKVLTFAIEEKDNLTKAELEHLFKKCTTDKTFSNNLSFAPVKHFEVPEDKAHDACYDAYMTGVVFATLTKYIQIGAAMKQKDKTFFQ